MTHRWRKLGQLYVPTGIGRHPKLCSHAANPLPVYLEGDVFRVFFSGRDENNRSSVGAVDIDFVQHKIIREHALPFFQHGPKNSFFADGVSIGNVYNANGVKYMVFMGWQNPASGHWRGDIGRLILTPELTLVLDSPEPLLGCDETDALSLSYPWVHSTPHHGFMMWYGSTLSWDAGNGEMLHVIKQASSEDGHYWKRNGQSVPYELGRAQAFSRPSVALNLEGDYEMWFSYRSGAGETYRIGYAKSKNGLNWQLALDHSGITVSDHGWDSEMVEYPYVFDHAGSRYMLYNGNGYGRTGFGLAVLDGY